MAAFEPHFSAYQQAQQWGGQMNGAVSQFGNMTVVDKVPPEMLHLIDPHWYQFAPMNPLWHSILGFVMCILTVVSVFGNGCVVYIFTSTKTLRWVHSLEFSHDVLRKIFLFAISVPRPICWWSTWPLSISWCCLPWALLWLSAVTTRHGYLDVSLTTTSPLY